MYHDEKARQYFGRFNLTEYDLVYAKNLNTAPTTQPTAQPTEAVVGKTLTFNVSELLENTQVNLVKQGDSFDLLSALQELQQQLQLDPNLNRI